MKALMSSLMKIKSVGEEEFEIVNHVAYLCTMLYTGIRIYKIVQHCK